MPDTQPTDREVIELLATRVMWWKYNTLDFPYPEPPVWFREATFCDGIRASSRCGNTFKSIVWNPLESIADAFDVVEIVRKKYCFQLDTVGFLGEEWRCMIGWSDDPISCISAAATAPRAICTAVMEMIEEEKKLNV